MCTEISGQVLSIGHKKCHDCHDLVKTAQNTQSHTYQCAVVVPDEK